jgi:D-3-phosphoglycerate dehydrogenase / 2-oxoglutarate reductase
VRPLLLTADITQSARSAITDELGYSIVDRCGAAHEDAIRDGAAAGAIGWLLEGDPCGEAEIAALPDLQWIACARGGPVNVDIPAATRRGIPVLYAPGRNAAAVADFVIGQIVCLVRHIAQTNHLIRTGSLIEERDVAIRDRKDVIWRPLDPDGPIPYHVYRGRELSTLTLGLLGLGRIGELVAAHGRGLGMRVVAHDPFVVGPLDGIRLVELDELLAVSDVLSLHARGSETLVAAAELRALRPGSYVINTARATILDYPALVDALSDGHLAGAALDVFPDEPLTPRDPLLALDNVLLTPHIAGASSNVIDHYSRTIVDALRALQRGDDTSTLAVANREVLARWSLDPA